MAKHDRLWQGVHDDAPTDDEGRPIHPEKGYPICAQPKTDATDPNKRDDVPYCLRRAGWGTTRPSDAGGACKMHGGAGGAPTGWRNGNARHLAYSKRMNDDDEAEYEALVETDDGDLIGIDEMGDMLTRMIGFEYMRLARAVEHTPGVEMVAQFECPRCGKEYRNSIDPDRDGPPTVGGCAGTVRVGPDAPPERCAYSGPLNGVDGTESVRFGDDAVERKQARLTNLMKTYKRLTEGQDVNVNADVDATVDGGMSVNITSVGVDLEDARVDDDDGVDDQ